MSRGDLITAALCGAALIFAGYCAGREAARPRLVGYGCGGPGPIYADEEDAFPICGAIIPNT